MNNRELFANFFALTILSCSSCASRGGDASRDASFGEESAENADHDIPPSDEIGTWSDAGQGLDAGDAPLDDGAQDELFDAGGTTDETERTSFSILTYNVAGLPEGISHGNPSQNTVRISPLLNDFDMVFVQEDFSYHAELVSKAQHPHRSQPNKKAQSLGDGLNFLSAFSYGDFYREQWEDCSGTLNGSSDCLTPKGFTMARFRLGEFAYLDVYDIHTDAGEDADSQKARRQNYRQLVRAIQKSSPGHAVIVTGDFNARYARPGNNLEDLLEGAGLTDVWVELTRAGIAPVLGEATTSGCAMNRSGPSCESIDKIVYRSSASLSLSPVAYAVEDTKFVDSSGGQLSDHRPTSARFDFAVMSGVSLGDQRGGPHGTPFNDLAAMPAAPVVTQVSLQTGKRVDAIRFDLEGGLVFYHGGDAHLRNLLLGPGEHLVSARVCQGHHNTTRVFYVALTSNLGRSVFGGTMTAECMDYIVPDGFQIVGSWGRSGAELDKLGFIAMPLP